MLANYTEKNGHSTSGWTLQYIILISMKSSKHVKLTMFMLLSDFVNTIKCVTPRELATLTKSFNMFFFLA